MQDKVQKSKSKTNSKNQNPRTFFANFFFIIKENLKFFFQQKKIFEENFLLDKKIFFEKKFCQKKKIVGKKIFFEKIFS